MKYTIELHYNPLGHPHQKTTTIKGSNLPALPLQSSPIPTGKQKLTINGQSTEIRYFIKVTGTKIELTADITEASPLNKEDSIGWLSQLFSSRMLRNVLNKTRDDHPDFPKAFSAQQWQLARVPLTPKQIQLRKNLLRKVTRQLSKWHPQPGKNREVTKTNATMIIEHPTPAGSCYIQEGNVICWSSHNSKSAIHHLSSQAQKRIPWGYGTQTPQKISKPTH